jgi:hypothetical protein
VPSKKKKRQRPRPSNAVANCAYPPCGKPFRAGERWEQVGDVERVHTACLIEAQLARKGADSTRDADGAPVVDGVPA